MNDIKNLHSCSAYEHFYTSHTLQSISSWFYWQALALVQKHPSKQRVTCHLSILTISYQGHDTFRSSLLGIKAFLTKNISFFELINDFLVTIFLLLQGDIFSRLNDEEHFIIFSLPDYILIEMYRHLVH